MDDAAISFRAGLVVGREGDLREAIADHLRAEGVALAASGGAPLDVLVFVAEGREQEFADTSAAVVDGGRLAA